MLPFVQTIVNSIGIKKLILAAVVLGSIATVSFMFWNLNNQNRQLSFELDRVEVLSDTTRLVYEDSMRVYQRRALQAEIERDDLDKELQVAKEASVSTTIIIDTVFIEDTAPVAIDPTDNIRRSLFTIYQEPITAEIEVSLPEPPAQGSIQMMAALDPIPLSLSILCAEEGNLGGVHAASFRVESPKWAEIQLATGTIDPSICSSQVDIDLNYSFGKNTISPLLIGAIQGAAVVYLIGGDGASTKDYLTGMGVSAGIAYIRELWPFIQKIF